MKQLSQSDNKLHARDNSEQFSAKPFQQRQLANQPETKTVVIVTQCENELSQPKNWLPEARSTVTTILPLKVMTHLQSSKPQATPQQPT
jgi:hypothetical protein